MGEMIKCSVCGIMLSQRSRFCSNCGAPVEELSYVDNQEIDHFREMLDKYDNEISRTPSLAKTVSSSVYWPESTIMQVAWVLLNICFLGLPIALTVLIPLLGIESFNNPETKKAEFVRGKCFSSPEANAEALQVVGEQMSYLQNNKYTSNTVVWAKLWKSKSDEFYQRARCNDLNDGYAIDQKYNSILTTYKKIQNKKYLIIAIIVIWTCIVFGIISNYGSKSNEKEQEKTNIKSSDERDLNQKTSTPMPTYTVTPTEKPVATPSPTDILTPTSIIPTQAALHSFDFTSNSDENAKYGNIGEYSYLLHEDGVSYEEYMLFDFDHGYAYFWQVGDGSQFYVRYGIEGNLNSGVEVIGYLSSDKTYTMNIKCKVSGNPDLLSGIDSDGDSFELTGTNLENAHILMNQRIMVDASKKLTPVDTPTPTAGIGKGLDFTNNDEEKALQGDSGLFAYSDIESTGTYAYIIFDFDSKLVFYFSDDEEDEYYEQFVIESGNLRDGVVCSTCYPDDVVTWNVRFRGENNPNEIEINTSKGKSAWVRRTNLNNALELLKTKKLYVEQKSETPLNTPTPEPTNTPLPTSSPTPIPTNTPIPEPTNTPTPTPRETSLDFTTNSEKKAQEGNSGVYSYKRVNDDTSSPEFVIIDFDKMLVDMIFHEGKKESTARMKIDSGDLNTYIIVCCYMPDSISFFGINFTYERNPEEIIVTTQAGGQSRYIHTNLNDAINKRDSIKLYDFSKP